MTARWPVLSARWRYGPNTRKLWSIGRGLKPKRRPGDGGLRAGADAGHAGLPDLDRPRRLNQLKRNTEAIACCERALSSTQIMSRRRAVSAMSGRARSHREAIASLDEVLAIKPISRMRSRSRSLPWIFSPTSPLSSSATSGRCGGTDRIEAGPARVSRIATCGIAAPPVGYVGGFSRAFACVQAGAAYSDKARSRRCAIPALFGDEVTAFRAVADRWHGVAWP